jgi:hypothetical protein
MALYLTLAMCFGVLQFQFLSSYYLYSGAFTILALSIIIVREKEWRIYNNFDCM